MSLPIKLFAICVCLLLTACGFQPVYGTSSACSANSPISSGIKIAATDGKTTTAIAGDERLSTSVSRQFTENFEDLLNPATGDKPKIYRLEVVISQSTAAVGISRDGVASRYNLTISSNYRLIRLIDNKLMDAGSVSNVTSYSNPSNQYFSTYTSEKDARKRGIAELAELYRLRISALTENPTPPVPPAPTPPPIYENCPKTN